MTEPTAPAQIHLSKYRKFDTAATLASVAALICWSVGPILIKYLTGHLDFWTQNALRYSVACLFWLFFLLIPARRGRFDLCTWRRAVLPALPNVLMQSTWAAAFYYIDPAFLVLLSNTSILWIAAFSLIFFAEERPLIKSRRFWSAMILSMAGLVGVVYFKEDFSARGTVIGIILALTGGFAWGVYTICAKVAFRDIDVREGFAVMSLYTTIVLWIFTMVFGRPVGALEIGYQPWLAVIISAIMGISLAHVLYYWAIKRIGATIPMLVVLAQPFLVFLVSRVIFGESLNILQLICGLVLLSGAAIAVWAQEHLKTSD